MQASAAYSSRPSAMLIDIRASDLMLSPDRIARSGQALTFARASAYGRSVDANGIYDTAAVNELRVDMIDESTPTILLERQTINRLTRSSDFANVWQLNNSPVITADALVIGDLRLSLIADASGVTQANVQQQPAVSGDGEKAIAVVLAPGMQPADGSEIFYRDYTDSVDYLRGVVTWSGGGGPIVVMSTGTYYGARPLAGGALELWFKTTTVTAAHTNVLQLTPAVTAGQQGSIYAGGGMIVDAPWPSSLIETPASATVERMADLLTMPIGFQPGAPGFTVYGKLWLAPAQGRTDTLMSIGSSALSSSDAQRGVGILRGSTGTLIIRETTGGAHTDAATAAVAATTPGLHEFLAHVLPGSIDIALDGASPVSSAQALISSFSNGLVYLPGDNNVRWLTLKVAAAPALTLADMQVLE